MPRKATGKVASPTTPKTLPPEPPKSVRYLHLLKDTLTPVFLVIWIIIGLFFLLVIYSQVKQGAVRQLITSPKQEAAPQVEPPTETSLEGIGKINIACVQEKVTSENIQKAIDAKSVDVLEGEDKTKFESCIVEKEVPSPSPQS